MMDHKKKVGRPCKRPVSALRIARPSHGIRNGMAKMDDARIAEIRAATGLQVDIARRFDVSQTTISRIRSRDIWTHLGPVPFGARLRGH